jgi:sulfoxide reductase heme-binding subunit YedZ
VRQAIDRILSSKLFKPAVFLAALGPAVWLVWDLGIWLGWWQSTSGGLGTDPTKELLHRTGVKALLFLFLSLSITPLRRLFSLNRLQAIRRMLGVWAFAYACLHVTTYLVLDRGCFSWQTCDLAAVGKDVLKRQFIWAGLTAFTVLLLLAATSTNWSVRLLKRWWQRLHRLVYLGAFAAIVHYVWIQKSDITVPIRWMWALVVLLGIRVYLTIRKRMAARQAPARPVAGSR